MNPILSLAHRLLAEPNANPERQSSLWRELLPDGVSFGQLSEAFITVVSDESLRSGPLVHTVGHIQVKFLLSLGETEMAGTVHFAVANVLDKHLNLNNPDEILPALRCAISHYESAREHLPAGHESRGPAAMQQADAHRRLADYGDQQEGNIRYAIALYQEAAKWFPSDSLDHGGCLINEANAWSSLAELGIESADSLHNAIDLSRKAARFFPRNSHSGGLCRVSEAVARANLATLDVEPEENLLRSIKLYQQAQPCFSPGTADSGRRLMNEANSWLRLADISQDPAEDLRQSIALCQQAASLLPPDSPEHGRCLMIEAAALRRLVNLKVEPEINHLLAITQDGKASHCFIPGTADWGRHRRITAHALRDLARREGGASGVVTLREAHALLRDGMEVVEGHSSEMFSEQSRKGFRETMVGQYQAMIEVCLELAAIEPSTEQREAFTWEAWHWCHRSKSRTLLDQLGSGRAQLDTPESQQFWNEMLQADAKLDRLDRLLLAMRANPSPDLLGVVADAVKAFKKGWDVNIDSCGQLGHLLFAREFAKENLAAARAAVQKSSGPLAAVEIPEGREIVRRLRARNAAHPAGMATIPSSRTSSPHDEQIQASGAAATDGAPGSRTLIAEYYVLGNDDIALFLVPLWLDQAPVVERLKLSLKALATAANSMMQSHGQLRGETRAARHVAKTRGRSEAERAKALEGSRQALRDIAPLAAAILNRAEREKWQPEELLLCPHYLLNLLPLHAAEVDGRPLIDHLPVAYLPSPAMALEWEEKPARAGTSPAGGEALIIGDPLGDLKGARQEANEVAKIARAAGLRAEPVIGRDALAAVTATGAPLARFIHAALHSLLDHEDFLRSGLEHADRRLPANEIMRLDLREALLVFLSSCDSGHAVVDRTDDLVALARAFFLAGTPSVIATLWALDDKAGVFFAPRFHHYWITGGLPMSRAFQKAMQETREEYTEPFYWAPFVLMGRWDTVWSLPAAA